MPRLLYTLLWIIALPAVMLRLLWRGRLQPGYRSGIAERFGRYTQTAEGPILWVHAVSVGETRAAQPLIDALAERFPAHRFVLTHMTPTGRETAQAVFSRYGDRLLSVYLPYDLPWLQRRFLRHFQPQLGIVMETEVWPNLMAACASLDVPCALVNARLSARSERRYLQLITLARETFSRFSIIAAQSEADGARLKSIGATHPIVTGNIKFDMTLPAAALALGASWRETMGARPVILAASTREGEEALILDAFNTHPDRDTALLVIVPRHPQRFDAVATQARALGLSVAKRSETAPATPDTQVWLGDSMGEMAAYYTLADVVLMGGTWLPFGGQNLIECCATGRAVLLGPHTYNFSDASDAALDAGAGLRFGTVPDAMREAFELVGDTLRRKAMGEAGSRFARQHGGATARTVALLTPLLDD
ncbi:lipid IV(A) 3-deoxy-D-manno-octulosonic acid transferase [Denitromonas ohlonensis]|uniref:3-deoxy-D-manno-octulosonic acid transferase n=2 Tax=Denitromonas TaxID=139331 RepID=A0A558DW40_9RHOO|nr:lipid IV(A) 3-deoxy-D-manno-octulosonic acid transferase [Denitromonas ohlonensis]TVO60286.1 3-deoxy-D-manno-octulosonic acid transferase [Denitromonas ohlonensis]TVO75735.1 3-deoxy-D-manno-octulosonic acid transferase [Denitromonas ohlonensis]TVT47061.1 MAG: 3-deoxy-D-manno-octulosonic acid transferase [Denitromonas halophila]TVT65265.1 MAG: 3-deoxy-D-manno-octulosonic acid transferase [Denitromonas halophila]